MIGDIVGIDFKLKVGRGVVSAVINESRHYFVFPDIIVCCLARIVIVVNFLRAFKLDPKRCWTVTYLGKDTVVRGNGVRSGSDSVIVATP